MEQLFDNFNRINKLEFNGPKEGSQATVLTKEGHVRWGMSMWFATNEVSTINFRSSNLDDKIAFNLHSTNTEIQLFCLQNKSEDLHNQMSKTTSYCPWLDVHYTCQRQFYASLWVLDSVNHHLAFLTSNRDPTISLLKH